MDTGKCEVRITSRIDGEEMIRTMQGEYRKKDNSHIVVYTDYIGKVSSITDTMDAKKAAELINTIRPDVAIPVHFGHIVGKPSDGEVFAENVMDPIKVEYKIAF